MSKAKDAYFDAKDQVKHHLDARIEKLQEFVKESEDALQGRRPNPIAMWAIDRARGQIEVLHEVHNYVRNFLLFDTEKYKEDSACICGQYKTKFTGHLAHCPKGKE